MSESLTLTVMMRPASGEALPAGGATSETVARYAPDPDAARRVQAWFGRQGFEVAPMVGSAFAVTASAERARAVLSEVPSRGEVPLARLPDELAENVSAVIAEPPLDFGPTSW